MPFPVSPPSGVDASGSQPSDDPDVPKPLRLNIFPEPLGRADQTPPASEGPGGFIFPQPVIHSVTSHLHGTPLLPVKDSSVDTESVPEKESLKSSLASMSIGTNRSSTGDSGPLGDSFGTLLSTARSSTSATIPSSSESWDPTSNAKESRKERRKEKEKEPSGLSLSKPTPSLEGEGDSASEDYSEASSSRSSSVDSESQDERACHQLPVTFDQRTWQQLTRQSDSPYLQVLVDEGNLSTPTVTPLSTPRAFTRPLSTSLTMASSRTSGPANRDIEKQTEGCDPETARTYVHGQGHVRWRSPLRVEHRESERYANIGHKEQAESSWGGESSNETTPLLGNQKTSTYSSSGDQANGSSRSDESRLSTLGNVTDSDSHQKKGSSIVSPSFPSGLQGFAISVKARLKKDLTQMPLYGLTAISAIPAVLLGCLLNVLDGVSCEFYFLGSLFFPMYCL